MRIQSINSNYPKRQSFGMKLYNGPDLMVKLCLITEESVEQAQRFLAENPKARSNFELLGRYLSAYKKTDWVIAGMNPTCNDSRFAYEIIPDKATEKNHRYLLSGLDLSQASEKEVKEFAKVFDTKS